jgi:cobalt-zinc-cadmium efflux system membrane fusion protein
MTSPNTLTTDDAFKALPGGRQWTILAVIAGLALALLFGVPLIGKLFAPKPQLVTAAPPPGTFAATPEQWATFQFVQVKAGGFQGQIDTDGKIAADDTRTTQVFSPYSGRITRVFAKAGDTVRAGQPLFAVQAAEFTQGLSDLATAGAQLKLAEVNEARLRALVPNSGAALKDLQQAQADLATAQASLAAARGRLRILGKSDAEIDALQAKGGPAETVVAAPISGVVLQRGIGVGQNIGSVTNGGTNPAFQISDLSTVWLVGNVREADSVLARLGQPIEVKVLALPGRSFTGKVDYVAPTVDPVTRRVTVRASLVNPGGVLRPEMFASFGLLAAPKAQAIVIPEDAVVFEGDEARVWVADPVRKTLELRKIVAGAATDDGRVQVQAGLRPGEWIVTSGSLFIDRAAKDS